MDFWNIDKKELVLMDIEKMYPPRLQFHVQVNAARSVRIHICFQGTAENMEMELLLIKSTNPGTMVKYVSCSTLYRILLTSDTTYCIYASKTYDPTWHAQEILVLTCTDYT